MKIFPIIGTLFAAMLIAASMSYGVGDRVGGNADILYESVNSGGTSFSTSGVVKLGGTLGQFGLMRVTTNTGVQFQNGFWKGEDNCEFYQAAFSEVAYASSNIVMTFNTMLSNVYTVASITHEGGGPMAGTHAWTNIVITFTGEGGFGSSTTIFHNVSALTNIATFYHVRCE
ncbi:MAG TPA: hypothetical protein PJ991_06265 [Kiritimatiellia bacterium]|nr:hypothetical protein [Kiritimatiellia bacterium]